MSTETGLDAEGLDAYRREVSRLNSDRDALKAELADMEGVVADLGAVRLGLQSELAEARAAIDRVRALATPGAAEAWFDYVPAAVILAALDAPQRPEDTRCPTPCDDDCDAGCHEHHVVRWRRDHQPENCPAVRPEDARTGVSAEGDGQ